MIVWVLRWKDGKIVGIFSDKAKMAAAVPEGDWIVEELDHEVFYRRNEVFSRIDREYVYLVGDRWEVDK